MSLTLDQRWKRIEQNAERIQVIAEENIKKKLTGSQLRKVAFRIMTLVDRNRRHLIRIIEDEEGVNPKDYE